MGRKSLKKDRGYITAQEWQTEWGGFKDRSNLPFSKLPFHCCAVSFTPFEDPCCSPDGTVYDLSNIVPYIQHFHRHPVTGADLHLKDIIQLTFHKNAAGEYHCPVLNKVFTEHTHILAVKPTGNVYCGEAIQELNIRAKNWKDLLTDEMFARKDIVTIQDPHNVQGRNLADFDHVKRGLRVEAEEEPSNIKSRSEDAQRIFAALNTDAASKAFAAGGGGQKTAAVHALAAAQLAARKASGAEAETSESRQSTPSGPDPRLQPPDRSERVANFKPGAATWNTDDPKQAPPWVRAQMAKDMAAGRWRGQAKPDTAEANGKDGKKPVPKPYMSAELREDSMHTTGAASRSFTSTAVNVVTKNERKMIRVERHPKAKAYLRLHTSLGDVNLELHCDIAPRTCENFLILAESGYYTGTPFHRCIRNFMIQGGDPTGTGTGGESVYGPTFRDEFDQRAQHSARGVLSMANSGPHTNGSQFFILFKSARHLDHKHTVFGRVVGGLEVLTAMEKVEVDEDDRPKETISITGATVYVNPYRDEEAAEKKAAEEARLKAEKDTGPVQEDEQIGSWFSNPAAAVGSAQPTSGVGKYMKLPAQIKGTQLPAAAAEVAEGPPAKKPKQAGYGNFDAW